LNPIAIVLILFAQLDLESLTKSVTEISDRLTKIEKLLEKPEPDKLIPIPDGEQSGLQLVDSKGQPLANAQDGRQFKVIASAAGKWSWQTLSPEDDVDVTESPDRLVCTLRNGADPERNPTILYVAHVTEAGNLATRIVRCGNGPRPPPVPDGDDDGDSKPLPPVTAKVGAVYLVWDAADSKATDVWPVIKDVPYWTKLRTSGVTAMTYLPTTEDEIGKWALEQMKARGIPPPAIVLTDKDRFLLDVVKLPASTAGVDAVIKRLGGT
jgi:hypothetical protein